MQITYDKSIILEAAIEQHNSVIHDFQERIQEMVGSNKDGHEEEYDDQDQSFKAETSVKINLLSEQLAFANRELENLMKMRSEMNTKQSEVRIGSVVVTNLETFFVSASIERFYVAGVPFFGLSVLSPLYQVMKGKKNGDTFSYKTTTYSITETF